MEKKYEKMQLSGLSQSVRDLEWRSRRLNLEIHGIPQLENENLVSLVNDVVAKLNVPILKHISAVHRLPSNPIRRPG